MGAVKFFTLGHGCFFEVAGEVYEKVDNKTGVDVNGNKVVFAKMAIVNQVDGFPPIVGVDEDEEDGDWDYPLDVDDLMS